ncbi:helix-turn-helix transcriptional regulator [Thomasclavelia sp.]|uniref:helix-turn-helix domain-containing protein n=1 Tax=Thomasclavelia sp. TaxID=3025757 RepID=UPI0025DD00CB|nr:helix-turn-helix transcriptional regulator [Thomasclavelia sp.]
MNFGKDIKRFRKERKLSRREVANALGIAYSTLTDYENEKIDPPLSKVMKIFDFYRINLPAYLITGKEYIILDDLSDVCKDKIFYTIREDKLRYKKY